MNIPAAIARWSARHRIAVLAVSAVALLVMGAGVMQLQFADNPLDAMPPNNPHTHAAENLTKELSASGHAGALYVTVNPALWESFNDKLVNRVPLNESGADQLQSLYGELNPLLAQATQNNFQGFANAFPGPHNITDEVYMRAQEELFLYLQASVPYMEWGITLPSQVKLVNYTNTGIPNPIPGGDAIVVPDPAAFRLPDTSPEGSALFTNGWQSYFAVSLDSTKTIVSNDWGTARMGLLFNHSGERIDVIGDGFLAGIKAYKDELRSCQSGGACSLEWAVFDPEGIIADPRSSPVAASHLTSTTLEDLFLLAPFAAGFIVLCMVLAFRRVGTMLAVMLPMGLAGVGVLGAFGFLGLPIHSVSLLVFPVLMGNGIDFAIHMASAYHLARNRGLDAIDAARDAGRAAGTPLMIATLTTVVGMGLLVFAPNRMISQLGLSILLGMVILLVMSLTTLPAALSFTRSPTPKRDILGAIMEKNARFWNRNKFPGAILVLLLIGGGIWGAAGVDTFIVGTPASYFPEDDPQREAFERSNELFFKGNEDLVTNGIVLEGPIATPQAMDFMGRLEHKLKTDPELDFVRSESAVSLRFALNAWVQVRQGTAGAPLVIAQESAEPNSTFPKTEDEIRFLLDEMFATPLETYAAFFTDHPTYEISIVLVEVYQADNFEGIEAQFNTLMEKVREVEEEGDEPSGLTAHIAGQTAVAYLFTKEEMPYVKIASLIGLAVTGLLVLLIRRNVRDALTVAAVVATSGIMWIATLRLLDIPQSIALVVPVVMIAAIGSDYALHLRYGLAHDGQRAWRFVGRAVLLSALTDLGAFLVFSRMRYGILADATLATVMALVCSLIATMLIVPLFARANETEVQA